MTAGTRRWLGEELRSLCAQARSCVVLIAPFVKQPTLERLLEVIPPTVPVRCLTRWRLDEVVAGVSDLGVWETLRVRRQASLALRHELHAKYYRVDRDCLIGSANLTDTALGWSARPNFELLVPLDADHPRLVALEEDAFGGCVTVDDDLYQEFRAAADQLAASRPPLPPPLASGGLGAPAIGSESSSFLPPATDALRRWMPRLRAPQRLFDAYEGRLEQLTTATREDALRELAYFEVPPGLPRPVFNCFLRIQLLQMPIVRAIDAYTVEPQRFGAVRQHLRSLPCAGEPGFDATIAWQTLMRWLLYFAPDRYMVWQPKYSEIFVRRPRASVEE